MDRHVTGSQLLAFADGELDDAEGAAVAAHLEDCADCQRRFAEQCAVDVALAAPLAAPLRAAMQQATERTLHTAASARRWRSFALSLAAAAALLLSTAWWLLGSEPTRAVVYRDRIAGATRAGAEERLHLEVTVAAPAWLAVFARDARGGVERLLPHPDPNLGSLGVDQPLQPGTAVRVPGAELFDFAVEPGSFRELVLVFADGALDETALAGLAGELPKAPPGELPAAIRVRHPRSRIVAVPE